MDKSKVFEVEIANSSPKGSDILSDEAMALLDQTEPGNEGRNALLSEKEKILFWG